MSDSAKSMGVKLGADLHRSAATEQGLGLKNRYVFECFDADGNLKWREENCNLTVNEGLDEILNQFWKGSGYTAAFFVGLTDGTPTVAAADTLASHAGWAEVTDYAESTREALSLGSVASQSVDNSASKASFAVNADATTVGGGFIATNNIKGGTSGLLIAVVAFDGGDKLADDGDTINVTSTLTAASV